MVKINYWLIYICILMACSNPDVIRKKAIIPSDKMVAILMQRQLVISEFNTFQYQGDFSQSNIDSLLNQCHQKLGYSDQEFEDSWQLYTNQANDELMVIYEEVLQELELLQEESKR